MRCLKCINRGLSGRICQIRDIPGKNGGSWKVALVNMKTKDRKETTCQQVNTKHSWFVTISILEAFLGL